MKYLGGQMDAVRSALTTRSPARSHAVSGLTIDAVGLSLPIGALCRIHSYGGQTALAEVIGFQEERTLLMPLSSSPASRAATSSKTSPAPRASGVPSNFSAAC